MTSVSYTPVGDPDAMRDLAYELLGRADLISTAAIAPSSALSGATFEGPAAVRLRGALDDAREEVLGAASRLRDVAAELSRDATEVERQNSELEREATRAAEAAAAKATAAANAAAATDTSTASQTSAAADTPAATPTDPVPPADPAPGTTTDPFAGEGA